MFRKVLRFENRDSRYEQKMNPDFEREFIEWKKLESGLSTVQMSFRVGFPERVTARLLGLLKKTRCGIFITVFRHCYPKSPILLWLFWP